jgi:FMN reductase
MSEMAAYLPRQEEGSDSRPLIVGIGGTTREGSSSERALKFALSAAEDFGARTVTFSVRDLLLPLYDPASGERSSEAARLVAALRDCDGVIIASPGYHGSVSGLIKNALDYIEDLSTDRRAYLDGRAIGCIACAYGYQAVGSTLATLRSIAHALRGWPTPLGVGINSSLPVFGSNGSVIEPQIAAQLRTLALQVTSFARIGHDTGPLSAPKAPRVSETGCTTA